MAMTRSFLFLTMLTITAAMDCTNAGDGICRKNDAARREEGGGRMESLGDEASFMQLNMGIKNGLMDQDEDVDLLEEEEKENQEAGTNSKPWNRVDSTCDDYWKRDSAGDIQYGCDNTRLFLSQDGRKNTAGTKCLANPVFGWGECPQTCCEPSSQAWMAWCTGEGSTEQECLANDQAEAASRQANVGDACSVFAANAENNGRMLSFGNGCKCPDWWELVGEVPPDELCKSGFSDDFQFNMKDLMDKGVEEGQCLCQETDEAEMRRLKKDDTAKCCARKRGPGEKLFSTPCNSKDGECPLVQGSTFERCRPRKMNGNDWNCPELRK